VTDIPGVEVNDVVTLIGCDGDQQLLLRDVAEAAETIPYEVACSIGKRVARVFRARTMDHAAAIQPSDPAVASSD
jgi:alanine racemase